MLIAALVVDLERTKPIALLADRSKPPIVHWLKEHPTIHIVARDRSEDSGLHRIEPQCRVTRLAAWRGHPPKPDVPSSPGSAPCPPFEGMTPRKVIGWMLARPETGSSGAREQLDRIMQMDDTLALARELTHGFLNLSRHHSGEELDNWLKDVRASTLREFLTCAKLASSGTKPRFSQDSRFPLGQDL